ncbi:MAG: response regulator [Patescibacteria group bacterium]|nr:response regulator [Patescibacteria group bacterium]
MESKKKIFIIDDDSFLLDMYSLKFHQSNFDVTTALGSEPALEKFRQGYVPDVVLMDIVMPVMDGFELIEKLKEENLAQNAIFIILSNRGQPSDIARGEALGAAGYIVKASSTPSEVIDKVNTIINNISKK